MFLIHPYGVQRWAMKICGPPWPRVLPLPQRCPQQEVPGMRNCPRSSLLGLKMRFHPQCMAFWIGKGRCFSQKFKDRSSGKQTMVFTPKCPTIILRKQTCSAWACSIDGSTSLRENRDHRTQKWDGFNWALECDQNKTSPLAWNPYHPHNLFLNYLNLQFYWSNLCQLLKFIPPAFGWSNPTSRTKFGKLTICMMGFPQWIHHHN